ncbi:hypothetical protein [Holdemanella biformis]
MINRQISFPANPNTLNVNGIVFISMILNLAGCSSKFKPSFLLMLQHSSLPKAIVTAAS